MLEEGSLVSFGRSESMVMHKESMKTSNRTLPPHGYLYPVVASYLDIETGFKYVTLRDAFGHWLHDVGETLNSNPEYHKDDRVKTDSRSGHCNTITVKVEQLPHLFDNIIASRYPDNIRVDTKKLGLQPWRTEYLKQPTKGKDSPARWQLTVIGHPLPRPGKKEEPPETRLSR